MTPEEILSLLKTDPRARQAMIAKLRTDTENGNFAGGGFGLSAPPDTSFLGGDLPDPTRLGLPASFGRGTGQGLPPLTPSLAGYQPVLRPGDSAGIKDEHPLFRPGVDRVDQTEMKHGFFNVADETPNKAQAMNYEQLRAVLGAQRDRMQGGRFQPLSPDEEQQYAANENPQAAELARMLQLRQERARALAGRNMQAMGALPYRDDQSARSQALDMAGESLRKRPSEYMHLSPVKQEIYRRGLTPMTRDAPLTPDSPEDAARKQTLAGLSPQQLKQRYEKRVVGADGTKLAGRYDVGPKKFDEASGAWVPDTEFKAKAAKRMAAKRKDATVASFRAGKLNPRAAFMAMENGTLPNYNEIAHRRRLEMLGAANSGGNPVQQYLRQHPEAIAALIRAQTGEEPMPQQQPQGQVRVLPAGGAPDPMVGGNWLDRLLQMGNHYYADPVNNFLNQNRLVPQGGRPMSMGF